MTISMRSFIVVLVLAVAPARVALSQIPYACCFGDDTCQDIDAGTCEANGGIPQGLALCGGIEACCGSAPGSCYTADRICCLANGDTPQGPGSTCASNPCGTTVPTVSEWSLIIMTVLAFTAGTILFSRRRRAATA